jgi:hypothetical protein
MVGCQSLAEHGWTIGLTVFDYGREECPASSTLFAPVFRGGVQLRS